MKASSLEEAVKLANGVEYGLTSGLESLDLDEINYWKEHMMAGNLYVNRPTTGAIVQRQPFGGIKASCFGFGMKAGGRNYVLQFMTPRPAEKSFHEAEKDYIQWARQLFEKETDYAHLRGQDNLNRYLKPDLVYILMDELSSKPDVSLAKAACESLGLSYKLVSHLHRPSHIPGTQLVEDWNLLLAEFDYSVKVRVLNLERLPKDFVTACQQKGIHLYGRPVSASGRIELLNYLDEQNFSFNYHRYGNLMGRNLPE